MSKYTSLTKIDFNNLIEKQKEDLYFDFKGSGIKPPDLQQHIVSFANGEGGRILIGFDEKNNKCNGYENMDQYDSIVASFFDVNPVIRDLKYNFIEFSGKYLIDVKIPKSQRVHETAKSEVYQRIGARKIKLNQEQITELKYKKGELKFEDEIKNIDIISVSESKYIKDFLKRSKINEVPKIYLLKNGFIYNNQPKISTIIFFHDEPQNILRCGLKINVFDMQKTSRSYIYKRQRRSNTINFVGPLEKIINDSLQFIFKSIQERKVYYPNEAIQEGLVNALIHRDFSISEDVIINLYDNSIEIISPGGFPGNLKANDFTIKNIKRFLRNPKICTLLFKISSIEKNINKRISQDQGEGIKTIFNSMKKAGLKEPKFEEKDNHVYLYLKHANAESYEKKILKYIKEKGSIANREARDLLGEEDKEVIKNIFVKLKRRGQIELVDTQATKDKTRYKAKNSNVDLKNKISNNEPQQESLF